MESADFLRARFRAVEGRSLGPGLTVATDALAPVDGATVVLKEAVTPAARRALAREVEALRRIAHPAFRRLRAHAEDERSTLAVLEHVEGRDLRAHLSDAPQDVRGCAVALLRALVHLHGLGLAHGDLKPDNVLVSGDGRLHLIDLGLVERLGDPPRGGTGRYLAPELRRGAPLTVAAELYSFGATLRDALGDPSRIRPALLGSLVDACLRTDPERRPASCDAALAALGETARAVDRNGALPRLDPEGVWKNALDGVTRAEGDTLLLHGGAEAGRTRVVEELRGELLARERPFADGTLAAGHDPLRPLARLLLRRLPKAPLDLAEQLAARLAARRMVLLLDDADDASEDVRLLLTRIAQVLRVLESGALVLAGADAELSSAMDEAGCAYDGAALPCLGPADVERLAEAAGARADRAIVRAIVKGSEGRAGAAARAVLSLAEAPELAPEELREIATPRRRGSGAPAAEPPLPRSADAARELAREQLDAGTPRLASHTLRRAAPGVVATPSVDPETAMLLADAEARSGRPTEALRLLEALGDALGNASRLLRALLLERAGRYADARRDASSVLRSNADAETRSRAAVTAAMASIALGELAEAEANIHAGLECAERDPESRIRLVAAHSDVALYRGDGKASLSHAQHAVEEARRFGDERLHAQCLARVAASHAMGGDPARAREGYAAALSAAQASGDVAGLAPHVMNLATAEHALGELGSAMAHYEEAARLATRLGRQATRASALVNLAGLLTGVGAGEEASHALDEAEAVATEAGAAIYAAQALLVRAELEGRTDPARGLARAREAREAFEACDARRQALEAELLSMELEHLQGTDDGARELLLRRREELERAGLGARAHLLAGRLAQRAEDGAEALRSFEAAARAARAAGDGELEARALHGLAAVHRALGTGGERALLDRAQHAIAEVAARLPPGLRERFVASWPRVEPEPAAPPDGRGLDERARRLLSLVRRVLLEADEARLLESAVDEAVACLGAERAFLLASKPSGRTEVAVARNLDRETLRKSRFRFSRSVAERVLSTGEPLTTSGAPDDPLLSSSRSVLELGLRSILCVPVRSPSGISGALYLDHRFETARFGEGDLELAQAVADIIGLALENARLHRAMADRARELERAHRESSRKSALRAAEVERLAEALARAGAPVEVAEHGMAGQSPLLRRAVEVARRVAPSDLPVLVEGESGTGKELLARFVHEQSTRAAGPFVGINCGALPAELLESELFGHVRGAFTGATRDNAGLFRTASGGTLLLDEIGEMPLRMQTRLLRVLQEGEVRPLGSDGAVRVDVRVVAATNRDLAEEVAAKRFRSDLYYRLAGVRVELPPLRERREDILEVARTLLQRIAHEPGMREVRISREAAEAMVSHDWPGNVRELEQALRRAVLVADGDEIATRDLGLEGVGLTRHAALRQFDRTLVEQALRGAEGNKSAAARALGISRVTLHRWIRRHGIE